jgi:hypothetical protein
MITTRGFFFISLLAAGIFLLASPGMAKPVQIQADAPVVSRLPLILKRASFGNGKVVGTVVNASLQNINVPDAQVCWGKNCDNSDGGGVYGLSNVASGLQNLVASKDGFVTITETVNVAGGSVVTQTIAMIPDVALSGLKYRILTTWSSTKCWPEPGGTYCWDNDLDVHLWRWDLYQEPKYHIGYYFHLNPATDEDEYWLDKGDCYGYPNACLERDTRYGYGPETIGLKKREIAMYYYGVLNYNQGSPGVPPISQTDALVRVYDITGLLKSYKVPTTGGSLNFWYVFALNGETGQIQDKNCIIDYIGDYNTTAVPQCP